MAEVVLDSSALLACLHREPGADMVAEVLPLSIISSVNLAEVISKLIEGGVGETAVVEQTTAQAYEVTDFNRSQAVVAGQLRQPTRGLGLSLGDRACLALALVSGLPALTANKAWSHFDGAPEIRFIR